MEDIRLDRLEFVGSGKHGEVYRLDDKRCIKIYRRRFYLRKELAALQRGAEAPFFPKVYEWGSDYIMREYVPGISLNHHLRTAHFTEDIACQLVEIVEKMRELRFRRADTRLSHVIIDPNGKLWLIDPVNTMKPSPPYPRKLIKGLMRRGVEGVFMDCAKRLYPKAHERWKKYVERIKGKS